MQTFLWWQTGVIYQIYPRSFRDGDGDGVGDLRGVIERLDYLHWLGVDAIWLSPIYPSPMADFGYDISDYTGIHPLFGTLADFDVLRAEAHRRGIKIVLDLVPNHSSDEHPWFVAARASRENPYRDWYIWRDARPDGGLPNNWQNHFGGPAWTLDAATGQYYLHLFDPKQPDLNWRNPAVRAAIYDAMRVWFARGVDGFRIDVIGMMIKDAELRDNPLDPRWKQGDPPQWRYERVYERNQPEVHAVIREMREVADSFPERVLIGELFEPPEILASYYGVNFDEVHLPFNFGLILHPTWQAQSIRGLIERYEATLLPEVWPNWVLGNHDQRRVASRLGQAQARVAQMLLLTLRGTPTLYYGDELAMEDVPVPEAMVQDPQGVRTPGYGRDPQRSPMQWDASSGAGFTTGRPWLPLAADYTLRNVAAQQDDPHSPLSLARGLLRLRRSTTALRVGSYASLEAGHPDALAYLRQAGNERVLVVLNFSSAALALDVSALGLHGEVRLSTHLDRQGMVSLGSLELRADEGIVVSL